jgi:adenosylhomocysteine nucleosidase
LGKTGLVFASKLESDSFINDKDILLIESEPFKIYSNKNYYIIISGIGKVNAGIAVSYLIWKYKINKIVNIGAAGAASDKFKTGDIFQINKVIEFDRPKFLTNELRIMTPDILNIDNKSFYSAVLATQDRPVIDADFRKEMSNLTDLADMEGAAVLQACRLWNVQCYLFKYISDVPGHDVNDIIKNIRITEKAMYEFFKNRIENYL